MTLGELLQYVYLAMQPEFTVFGVSVNLWGMFVFVNLFGIVIWFINKFLW